MNKGEIIDNSKVGQISFDPKELLNAMRKGAFWTLASWGAREFMVNKDQWLRFRVSGHHHKGLVYIVLGWDDTFTLYYTTLSGKIKDKRENVYIDELVQVLDKKIEFVEAYKK